MGGDKGSRGNSSKRPFQRSLSGSGNPRVKALIEDAEGLLGKALEELDLNVRDAAEKAWGATVRATDALILRRTGVKPAYMSERRSRLEGLCLKDGEVDAAKIAERMHSRETYLHGQCFYEGICKPEEAVKRRILETRDYIEDVKRLIG